MADKLDRIIESYVTGGIDKQIKARVNQITYESKVSGLDKDSLEQRLKEDRVLLELKYQKAQIEVWYDENPEAKKVCELRWRKGLPQWAIGQEIHFSESTVYRRYTKLKSKIARWSGL
ncbi:DUF722 domain-containing protein [Lactococcus taiwanensis]|uniref:DUF722 domain-containing protein n=1 Tax=Lactococcus taiwanensis TaxID=1151742 RepID=UPI00196229F6|nr:DUF722 domain-containing protein [Lactococcus taiwanensis]QRZ11737.1 DUF722 domain-containing protein [Lactococcus taiwanensis]